MRILLEVDDGLNVDARLTSLDFDDEVREAFKKVIEAIEKKVRK